MKSVRPKLYTASNEAELLRKAERTTSPKNQTGLKQRLNALSKIKPNADETYIVQHSDDGTTSKTFYAADGTTSRVTTIESSGQMISEQSWTMDSQQQTADVMLCGEPVTLDLTIQECTPENVPGAAMIMEACPELDAAALCCLKGLCVTNQWSSPPDFCPCPLDETTLSWDAELGRFVGTHPQCGCPPTWQLHVWYSGGQWHWLAGSEEDPVAQGTIPPDDVTCGGGAFELNISWFSTSVNSTFNMRVTMC